MPVYNLNNPADVARYLLSQPKDRKKAHWEFFKARKGAEFMAELRTKIEEMKK